MCIKCFVLWNMWLCNLKAVLHLPLPTHTSTNQTRYIPALVNNFTLISATQVIFHSPVRGSGGLITGDPRALARIVAAEVLMQALPCRWPGHLAPSRSAACRLLPPGGRARALQHPGTCCSFSWPPLPSTWSRIRNPGRWAAKCSKFQVLTKSTKTSRFKINWTLNQCGKQGGGGVKKMTGTVWRVSK